MMRHFLCRLLLICLPSLALAGEPGTEPAQAPLFLLYASPVSQRALSERGFDQRAQVNQWRDLLRDRRERYQIVTSIERLARIPENATLVLPSAIALDTRERAVIRERLARGDHLIATATPGMLDERDVPRGSELIAALLPDAANAEPLPGGQFLTVSVSSPLTAGVSPEARVWLDERTLALMPALPAPADAYLADWSRQGARGVMMHATVGTSRRVLLGWPEAAWAGDRATFMTIAGKAVDWAANRPMAIVAAWPPPYRAAMTLGIDATWQFERVAPFARSLAQREISATFNFLAVDAAAQRDLIETLRGSGHDIGTLGDRWLPFAGQPESEQAERLSTAAQAFAFSGLRAPEGRTDEATERAAKGIHYVVDSGRINTVLPLPSSGHRPSVLANPLNLVDAMSAAQVADSLQSLSATLVRVGGYSYVGVDAAHLAAAGPIVAGIETFFASPQRAQVWLTDAGQIARWIKSRERVTVTWDGAESAPRLSVQVSADEGTPLPPGMTVLIYPPAGRRIARIEGPASPAWFDAGDGALGIDLSGRTPGAYLWDVRLAAP